MYTRSAAGYSKYVVLGLLCITWIVNYFEKVAINVASIPLAKEFGLNESRIGLVLSSFFLSYALMQPVGGWLSDRFGSRKVILFSALFWSVFTIVSGWAWSFVSLLVVRFLFGIGEGSYPSASTVAVAESFPYKQRARAKSVLTSATTLGGMLGSLVAASLITSFGWRSMFFILGALGVVLCIILFFFLKPAGSDERRAEPASHSTKVRLKQLLKIPLVWQLTAIYFGASLVTWGMNSWMPSYLVKVRHLSMVSMGALSSIPALVGFAGVLLTGWLLDKKALAGRERLLIMTGALLSCICIYLMFQASTVGLVIFYQCLSTIGTVLVVTPALTLPLKYISRETIGSATGCIYFGGQTAGIIAPSLMGFMIHRFNGSYQVAFWVMIAGMFIPFLVSLALRTKGKAADTGPGSVSDAEVAL